MDEYYPDGTVSIPKDHLEHISEVFDYMQSALEGFFYRDNEMNRNLTKSLIIDFISYNLNHLKSVGCIQYIGPTDVTQCEDDGSWDIEYSFHDTDPNPVILISFRWNSKSRNYT